MTTYNLRPHWREDCTPLGVRMPVDPPPTLADFESAYVSHLALVHEDWEDRLNQDGTWGPGSGAAPGGSGISWGYSSDDLSAVVVAERAVFARPLRYDFEHWVRQVRYAIAAWDMTHAPIFARRLVVYDGLATGHFTNDPSTVHLDDPGWIPDTLAQYHAMAEKRPHRGLPWNCRALGEVAWGRAARMRCDRTVTPAWAEMLLATCELAAQPGTGQQGNWQEGPFDFEATGQTYTFHEAILLLGAAACCRRLHRPAYPWMWDLLASIESAPAMDNYGAPSPVSYWSTEAGMLVPVDRPDQHGDPAFGWFSSACVAMRALNGDDHLLDRATRWGPTKAVDEQSRKFSMLYRGATGG